MTQRTLKEVADAVNHRRRELGLTELRLRGMTGLDRKTLSALLEGTRWAQEETRLKVEAALGWTAGSIADIRGGRPPTPLPVDEHPLPLSLATVSSEALIDELRDRLLALSSDEPERDGRARLALHQVASKPVHRDRRVQKADDRHQHRG
jgi:hypothetical protein